MSWYLHVFDGPFTLLSTQWHKINRKFLPLKFDILFTYIFRFEFTMLNSVLSTSHLEHLRSKFRIEKLSQYPSKTSSISTISFRINACNAFCITNSPCILKYVLYAEWVQVKKHFERDLQIFTHFSLMNGLGIQPLVKFYDLQDSARTYDKRKVIFTGASNFCESSHNGMFWMIFLYLIEHWTSNRILVASFMRKGDQISFFLDMKF